MYTKSRFFFVQLGLASWWLLFSVHAEHIAVNMAVDPAAAGTNRFAMIVNLTAAGLASSDTDEIDMSGTIQAGLEVTVTPHTFRRSCTTELLRSGAGMYHVKELLGHESLDTLKHYAKLTITDLRKAHAKHHPREKDR